MREAPQTLFPKLFKAWKITHLVFEKDTDAYARDRDAEVIKAAKEAGVEVIVRSGRTLWDSDELVEKNKGKPTMTFSQVQAAGAKVCKIFVKIQCGFDLIIEVTSLEFLATEQRRGAPVRC